MTRLPRLAKPAAGIRTINPRWLLAGCLLSVLCAGAGAQSATIAYDLENVWLSADVVGGGTQPMTGRFEWTYDLGDFENGTGVFVELDLPWTSFGIPSLIFTFDADAFEITLAGKWHDQGVDVMLKVIPELSPTTAVPVDLVNSSFQIENGIIHQGHMISGMVVPDLSAVPWVTLGGALAGSNGAPVLAGTGTMVANDPIGLELINALDGTAAALVVGLSELNAPLKGGVLVPDPLVVLTGFTTGPSGAISLQATWPAGMPAGFTTYYQWWITDGDGPVGFAASNALAGTTP